MIRVVHREPSVRITQKRKTLQDEIDEQGNAIHRLIVPEYPQRYQPCCVHRHDQQVMPGRDLNGAAGQQSVSVVAREGGVLRRAAA